MKAYQVTAAIAITILAASLAACVTTETTMPDGTVIKSSGPAPGAVEATADIAAILAARVTPEK